MEGIEVTLGTAEEQPEPESSGVKQIVICDENDIKHLTIEWNRKNLSGFKEADKMITERFGEEVYTRTVRLGPKDIDDMKVSKTISQWIVDVYI